MKKCVLFSQLLNAYQGPRNKYLLESNPRSCEQRTNTLTARLQMLMYVFTYTQGHYGLIAPLSSSLSERRLKWDFQWV